MLISKLSSIGKNKTAVLDLFGACDIEKTDSSNSHKDEGGREVEEKHHIQRPQAEGCKRVEGLGWCFFLFELQIRKTAEAVRKYRKK